MKKGFIVFFGMTVTFAYLPWTFASSRVVSKAKSLGIQSFSVSDPVRIEKGQPFKGNRSLSTPQPETLKCDNGMVMDIGSNGYFEWNEAVRLTPSNPCTLLSLLFYPMDPDSELPNLTWGVWDDDDSLGFPNTLLDSGTVIPTYNDWFPASLLTPIFIDSGDIYIGWLDIHGFPFYNNAFDDTLKTYDCNYWFNGSFWEVDTFFDGDFLVRGLCNPLPVGVEEESDFRFPILDFRLMQNAPNPFHSSTFIRYQIPQPPFIKGGEGDLQDVRLVIYDITGRLVETLVNESQESGVHRVLWDGKDQKSGIYFYRLQISQSPFNKGDKGDFIETKKMVLLR